PARRQRAIAGAAELERPREDRGLRRARPPGELAPGRGRDRDPHRELPPCDAQPPAQGPEERARDSDLADRDRVDPDAALEPGIRAAAEAAAEISQPPAPGERAGERKRSVGGEGQ